MKSILILIILSVLVLVGCGDQVDSDHDFSPIVGKKLYTHIGEQMVICYNKFDNTLSDNAKYDSDETCNVVEQIIRDYARYGHLCYIMDMDAEVRDMYYLDCESNIVASPFQTN